MDRVPTHVSASEIAFRKTCAWWKKRIHVAGGTDDHYYAALGRWGLKKASDWTDGETRTREQVLRSLGDEYGALLKASAAKATAAAA